MHATFASRRAGAGLIERTSMTAFDVSRSERQTREFGQGMASYFSWHLGRDLRLEVWDAKNTEHADSWSKKLAHLRIWLFLEKLGVMLEMRCSHSVSNQDTKQKALKAFTWMVQASPSVHYPQGRNSLAPSRSNASTDAKQDLLITLGIQSLAVQYMSCRIKDMMKISGISCRLLYHSDYGDCFVCIVACSSSKALGLLLSECFPPW